MAEHGRVIAVGDELLGDEFAEDTAAGSTVLQLVDVADFDEAGGKVRIGGVVVDYLTVDDAAATMTLASGLAADADAGDHLDAWDEATNTAAIDRIASVAFDGQTDGEAIECVVAQHLRRELPPGIRGEIGESVLIETEGDEWRVIDVLGVREQAAVRFWQDQFIVAAPGLQELDLTFEPILNSEHLYWNGDYQPQTEWSRAADIITVPDVNDDLYAGDVLVVEYAYLPGTSSSASPAHAAFVGSDAAAGAVNATSVDIPIPAHAAGDTLVLFVGRGNDMDTLSGWTLVNEVSIAAGTHLYAFSKTGDGVISSVTVTTADVGAGDVNVGGVALAYSGSVTGTTGDTLDPATSASVFTAPNTSGQIVVVAALFDGEGAVGSGSEVIAVSMSGATRENLNCGSGNWSLAVAEGEGTFTDAGADADDHEWLGIAVAIDR